MRQRRAQGAQQTVIGLTPLTPPVGWPPFEAHVPPIGPTESTVYPIVVLGAFTPWHAPSAAMLTKGIAHPMSANRLTVVEALHDAPVGAPHPHAPHER